MVDLIQGSPPSSVQCLSSQRGQKRSLEDPDSDVVFVCKTRILKRTMKEKVQPQQQSSVPAQLGTIKVVEPSQAGFSAFSFFALFIHKMLNNFLLLEIASGKGLALFSHF